ncbi:MAG: hypothetical protein AAB368_08175, partial [bacterium]
HFLVLPLLAALLVLLPAARARSALLLAGWLAGAAAGPKYLGGALVILLLVWIVRRGLPARAAVWFAAGAAAAGGYWYVRNALWTGNPVFPVLFGGPHWTPADMAGWRGDARAFELHATTLLTAPWSLLRDPTGDGGLSPVLMTAAAAPLLWPAVRRDPLWGLVLALVVTWWITSPLPRYLVPALALCAAASAAFLHRGPLTRGSAGRNTTAAMMLAGIVGSLACGVQAIQGGTMPYETALGKLDPREYRREYFRPRGFVEMLESVERRVPPRGRAYLLGHLFSYDLPRRVWFEFLYTRPALYWWLRGADSAERIAARARQAGLTHLVYQPLGARAILGPHPERMDWTPALRRAYASFWRRHVTEEERLGTWVIYRIERRPGRHPLPAGTLPGTEGAGPATSLKAGPEPGRGAR